MQKRFNFESVLYFVTDCDLLFDGHPLSEDFLEAGSSVERSMGSGADFRVAVSAPV